MITVSCSTPSFHYREPQYRLVSACRIVIVLIVLILAMVLALRGYSPEAITGPVLVLVVGTVGVVDRLVGVQSVQAVSTVPAL